MLTLKPQVFLRPLVKSYTITLNVGWKSCYSCYGEKLDSSVPYKTPIIPYCNFLLLFIYKIVTITFFYYSYSNAIGYFQCSILFLGAGFGRGLTFILLATWLIQPIHTIFFCASIHNTNGGSRMGHLGQIPHLTLWRTHMYF